MPLASRASVEPKFVQLEKDELAPAVWAVPPLSAVAMPMVSTEEPAKAAPGLALPPATISTTSPASVAALAVAAWQPIDDPDGMNMGKSNHRTPVLKLSSSSPLDA